MKVVHVSPLYFEENSVIGGGERYPLDLAKAMSEKVETELVSFSSFGRVEKAGRLTIRLFKPWFFVKGQKIAPLHLPFLGALKKADIIHCYQYYTFTTSLCILYARLSGKKIFVTDLGGRGWDPLSNWLPMGDLARGFMHLSEYAKKIFPDFKVRHDVVYGGADEKRFYPLDIAREKKVLFVGRLLPHKGVDCLINAVGDDVALTIAGKPYSPEYLEYLKGLARGKDVRFISDASDEDLLKEYNMASVFVLPSVYKDVYGKHTRKPELLGLVVLEAMACKTPVIVTDVGSLPELVNDGETGFVVPPNDPAGLKEKIYALINNPAKARQMGDAAYDQFKRRFTWASVVENILSIYGD